MLTRTRSLALSLPLLATIACSSDDGATQVNMRDAQIGWTATNEAAAAGHGAFTAQVPAGQEGEILVACSGGGETRVVGTLNAADDFQLDTTFDGCIDDDVIIDGDLTLVVSLNVDVDIDDDGTDDDRPKHFHYVKKDKIAESAVMGTHVVALCGEVFPVTRAAKPGSPVCPDCKRIYETLKRG